jgi:16S rRNA (uracil1498-N3)-methyltransferase
MIALMASAKIRLFVDHPLGAGQSVPLSREQAHYLFGVMRMTVAGQLFLFNGRDGEFLAAIVIAGKRGGVLECVEQTRPLQMPPDLWVLFAPIKKARTDFIVEKATEMGASRIMPVRTDFTNSDRLKQKRLQAHATEAAEQCGGTFVPEMSELQKLDKVLSDWPAERRLMFCDEVLAGDGGGLDGESGGPWAILIGPEGGFSDAERDRLNAAPFTTAVSLGPRILRADTAVVAAMTVWQCALGDWK